MRIKQKKYFSFDHAVLPFQIRFYFGYEIDEAEKSFDVEFHKNTVGYCIQEDDIVKVWISKKHLSDQPVYVHELYHAAHFMFRATKIEDYNEAMAYELGYLVEKYLEGVKQFREREKKKSKLVNF